MSDVQESLNTLHDAAPALLQLEEAYQFEQLQDLVDAAEAGHAHHLRVLPSQNELVRHDRDDVNEKPAGHIVVSNIEAVIDNFHVLVVEGKIESDDDVDGEHYIDDGIDDLPGQAEFGEECDLQWCHEA